MDCYKNPPRNCTFDFEPVRGVFPKVQFLSRVTAHCSKPDPSLFNIFNPKLKLSPFAPLLLKMEPITKIADLHHLPHLKNELKRKYPDTDILVVNLSDKHELV